MPAYLFTPQEYEPVPTRHDAADDEFLFNQGPARGLGKIRFNDWHAVYADFAHVPNVARFDEQAVGLVELLAANAPDDTQRKDLDFLLTLGELFTMVVYGQLILEQAALLGVSADVLDQIFDVLIRDFSAQAVELHGKPSATDAQQEWALSQITRPVADPARAARIWAEVEALSGAYEMNP
jgi:hypothetical protein